MDGNGSGEAEEKNTTKRKRTNQRLKYESTYLLLSFVFRTERSVIHFEHEKNQLLTVAPELQGTEDWGRVPPLLQLAGHERHSGANKKLTKIYRPSRKRSPKRLIIDEERKKWRGTTNFLTALRTGHVPTARFQICSGATVF